MHHLIVGAGPSGVIAAENLRKISKSSSITVIGNESHPAYSRMALPYMLAGDVGEKGTYLRQSDRHYDDLGIEIRNGTVRAVKPDSQTVTLASGESVDYDRLLIATGSSAIRPPIPGMDLAHIHNCWTLDDAYGFVSQAKAGDRVVLLGAGFIGCIVLQALVSMGLQLTVIELADRMLARMMDDAGGEMIRKWCEGKGVAVKTGAEAVGVTKHGDHLDISLADGTMIAADHIVCAAGVKPNVDFLNGSGVEVNFGVVVDHRLQTNVKNIFAAGDVAEGPDLSTGERQVHAIQPTASEHGRIAARQMSGDRTPYGGSLAMNVLNTLGLITSSYGLWQGVDGGDRSTVEDSAHNRYLRLEFQDDVLVGSLAIGLTQHVGVLRGLIQTKVKLGKWKKKLMNDPSLVMHAYLECMHGTR